jgi:hypothetical protein
MKPWPNLKSLHESLQWLSERGYLSGSFARNDGTGTFKDVDVRLADRHVKKLRAMLDAQGVEWDSPFVGCITWWPEGKQVETAFLFPRYKTGPKIIDGICFRT